VENSPFYYVSAALLEYYFVLQYFKGKLILTIEKLNFAPQYERNWEFLPPHWKYF